MEKQLGYSPLEAGVGMLPFLATFALVSFVAGPLYDRLGAKPLAVVRRRLHHPRALPLLAGRRRLRLRLAGRRHGRPRDRDRQLLPDRDHRRGDLGRRIADQPRRRDHLHVPDRRRLDRAGPDDDRLLRRRSRPSSTASRPASGSTRRSRWSACWSRSPSSAAGCGARAPAREPRPELPAARRVRRPGPPSSVSSPGPPRSRSLPGPPTSRSSPGPPKIQSSPLRPISTSSPGPPTSLSAPPPPDQAVAPGPPRSVTGTGMSLAKIDGVVAAAGVDFEAGDRRRLQSEFVRPFFGVPADVAARFQRRSARRSGIRGRRG